MRIEEDIKLDYNDVLIKPRRSNLASRSDVDICREYHFKWAKKTWTGTGIVAANMDTVGTFEMAKKMAEHHLMTAFHKFYSLDEIKSFALKNKDAFDSSFVSIGSSADSLDFLKKLDAEGLLGKVCLDIANGYSKAFCNFVSKIRDSFPDVLLMAGNVATPEMTEDILLSGADIVKIGIGPGSGCTTRKITGVGYPQLSAVIECADAAHGVGGMICADGGCVVPADISKAFGAGADFVMLGGMLAAHDESGGEIFKKTITDGTFDEKGRPHLIEQEYRAFYGMSSQTAQEKYYGGLKKYRASEGRSVQLPSRGPVDKTILEFLGGIRSMMTYIGASRLKDVPKCTTFVRVRNQYNTIYGK